MNISIRTQGIDLTTGTEAFVRGEIHSTLERFNEDIVAIDVFMKDTNGPKGGVDQQVLMRIQMRGRQQLALQTTRESLHATIRASAKRAKRAIRRNLRKARRFERLSLRSFAVAAAGREVTEA